MVEPVADRKTNLFWDSCVFYAFFRDETEAYDVNSIAQYIEEAREGKHQIYTSSLVLVEVVPSAIKKPEIGTLMDFVDDLQGAVIIIDASPNVMHGAACLKDLPYKRGKSPGRRRSRSPDQFV